MMRPETPTSIPAAALQTAAAAAPAAAAAALPEAPEALSEIPAAADSLPQSLPTHPVCYRPGSPAAALEPHAAAPFGRFAAQPFSGNTDFTVSPDTAARFRTVAADEVFGTLSTSCPPVRPVVSAQRPLTGHPLFQGFILLLAAAYILLLHRHLDDAGQLLGRFSRNRVSGERISEDAGGNTQSRLLHLSVALGVLLLGAGTVKYIGTLHPGSPLAALPPGAAPLLTCAVAAAAALVGGCQTLVLRTAGAVTLTQPFIAQLQLLRRTFFTLATLLVAPGLLFFILCPPHTGLFWSWAVIGGSAITAILYLIESLRLFISKKISILHWFLYLCIVEIFPVSLLWLLVQR